MENQKQNGMLGAYFKNLLLAAIISVLMLLLCAFLLYKTNLSPTGLGVMLVITYILSNLIGGYRMGKKAEKRQFLWGFFVGLGYFAILLLVSFLGNNFYLGDIGKTILVFSLCSFSGMFGGMLS